MNDTPRLDRLTCLTCGRFQGTESPVRPAAGWVQTGGFAGPMQVCGCCQGTGWHPTHAGLPACHDTGAQVRRYTYLTDHDHEADMPLDTRTRIKAIEEQIRCYHAEADARAFTLLLPVYGQEEAERLTREDPPL